MIETVGQEGRQVRVLLVDDDRSMLEALSSMVEGAGHQALRASSSGDALKLFREHKPDIALLDVMMPHIDGYKLTGLLKAEADDFVPVILITGLGDLESKRRGMAAGADDFLSKPVAALELEIRLRAMLRIKSLTDQLGDANRKLAELATTDGLTSLLNRRAIYQHLDREFKRASRHEHSLAVLLLDIDFFKQVNDNLGHAVGDRVLVSVSELLRNTVRETDFVGRYGGEEFLVIAPETPSSNAQTLAERVRRVIEQGTRGTEGLPPVTVSIGVATSLLTGIESADALVQAADGALYAAKDGGRNRWVSADGGAGAGDEPARPASS